MVKRSAKTGSISLLSKEDRVFLADFRKAAKNHVDRVVRTRETAMKELIDAGIYGKNGKLTKRYRSVA